MRQFKSVIDLHCVYCNQSMTVKYLAIVNTWKLIIVYGVLIANYGMNIEKDS